MEEKKLTSNDLIVSLASDDFRRYFREQVFPHLQPIEESRIKAHEKTKKALKISAIVGVVAVVIFVLPMLFTFVTATFSGGKEVSGFAALVIMVVMMPLALLPLLIPAAFIVAIIFKFKAAAAKNELKELVRTKIKPVLFSYFGNFRHCNEPSYTGVEAWTLLRDLKIYPCHDTVVVDDCIEGEYNGLKFKIIELDVSYVTGSGKSRQIVPVFGGLMLEVDMNKKFTSHTIVKTGGGSVTLGREFLRVNLEDPEFERIFDVYSTDQVEARYLLTTAFMRRFVELKIAKGRVEAVFWNQKVYFFVTCGKDMFELPLDKNVADMKHYQEILLDFARILRAIDMLKLEQDIGL